MVGVSIRVRFMFRVSVMFSVTVRVRDRFRIGFSVNFIVMDRVCLWGSFMFRV